LEDYEKKCKFAIELAPIGIVNLNMKGTIISVNAALLEATGYSEREIVGKHFAKLEFFRTQDIPKFLRLYNLIVSRRAPKKIQYPFIHKDGSLHWCEAFVGLLKKSGRTVGIQAMCIDTTKVRQAEQKMKDMSTKQKLLNEKLNVISQLTRHNIRNKLSAITGNVYLGKKQLAADHKALEHLEKIELACSQIVRILNFAGVYEKLGVEEATYINLERTFQEALSLFPDFKNARIVKKCKGVAVLADSLLMLVFYNLIDNTMKHGEKATQIALSYEDASADELKLIYEDNGNGIPWAEKSEVFSKGYVKDKGYGLHLVQEIMNVYGWTIEETGRPGKNAKFTITIPKTNRKGKINYRLTASVITGSNILSEPEGATISESD
jgi:PAS domain S-box-containing protein